MLVSWASSAHRDLLEISKYLLENEGKEVATAVAQRIIDSARILASFPLSGKIGRIEGTREIQAKRLPYVLVYQTFDTKTEILRVFHTSRLFPSVLEM
jgi:addiction module toxin, RelE/StbE family